MNATLIVVSKAGLSSLENALGESRLKTHDIGSLRSNGIIRKQSIWMRDWSVLADPPTSPLSQVLDWYASRRENLLKLDPAVSVRLSAEVDSEDGFAVPIELSAQLSALQVYLTVDIKNGPSERA